MTAATAARAMVWKALRGAKPPAPPPTRYEFATTLLLTSGPKKGRRYDPKTDACQHYLLEQMDRRGCTTIAFLGSPQVVGKTTSAILPVLLHGVIATQDSVGYGLPTLDSLNQMWATRLKPAITDSGYGGHLPKKGPGSKDGRPATLQFEDPITGRREGQIIFMTGGAYGMTARIVVIDDVDQFKLNGVPDRESVEDIRHRTDSFGGKAFSLIAGTIEDDVRSIICALVDESTGTVPWARCPHCQRHQRLAWENVVYDPTSEESAMATARYRCGHCAVLWTEADRHRAIAHRAMLFCDRDQVVEDGKIVGPASRSSILGLTVEALNASQADIGILCREHREAKLALDRGDHALMRKFVRYRLCRRYRGDQDEEGNRVRIDRELLARRSATAPYAIINHDMVDKRHSRYWAEVPRTIAAITAAIDVQQDRLYWSAIGWDDAGRSYHLAYGYECACEFGRMASVQELHAALDRVHGLIETGPPSRGPDERGGWPCPVTGRGIDIGYRPEEIDLWRRAHPAWLLVKGAGDEQAHAMDRTDPGERYAGGRFDIPGCVSIRETKTRRLVHHVDVDAMREVAQGGFLVPAGQPGAAHLPRGLVASEAYIAHLCARALIIDQKSGRRRWSRDRRDGGQMRKDYLDVATYQQALYRLKAIKDRAAEASARAAESSPAPSSSGAWVEADDNFNSIDLSTWE